VSDYIKSLSVVLPVYNEEAVIEETLGKVFEYLKSRFTQFEVVVVEDGSTDKTAMIVESMLRKYSQLKTIRHEKNRGYGEALRSGFNASRMEWVLLMDSDGQLDIRVLDSFLPFAENNDVVVGYRNNRADSWWRPVLTWGYMSLINFLFEVRLRDIGCAFKLFRRSVWEKVCPIKSSDHKIFSVEWMWKIRKLGVQIKELPVKHYPRVGGKPTGARFDVVWAMLCELFRLRFYWKQ
jgi:glycosyltransferase involved in cell wall biosynthesis